MGKRMNLLLLSFVLVATFSFATAESWKYNYLNVESEGNNSYNITNNYYVTNGTNYNATYLQGYTPLTLRDYYETYFDTIYAPIGSVFSGSWNDLTDIPAGFADGIDNDTQLTEAAVEAYIFDNDNTGDLETTGNITAGYFIGDGSELTGIQAAETDFETYLNGSAYVNITYNLTAGDADNLERTIEPGKQFIFGDTFT